jgi:hypothetical protein
LAAISRPHKYPAASSRVIRHSRHALRRLNHQLLKITAFSKTSGAKSRGVALHEIRVFFNLGPIWPSKSGITRTRFDTLTLARPQMVRLSAFSLLIWPSIWPLPGLQHRIPRGFDILSQDSNKPPHSVNAALPYVFQPKIYFLRYSATMHSLRKCVARCRVVVKFADPTFSASTLAIYRAVIWPRAGGPSSNRAFAQGAPPGVGYPPQIRNLDPIGVGGFELLASRPPAQDEQAGFHQSDITTFMGHFGLRPRKNIDPQIRPARQPLGGRAHPRQLVNPLDFLVGFESRGCGFFRARGEQQPGPQYDQASGEHQPIGTPLDRNFFRQLLNNRVELLGKIRDRQPLSVSDPMIGGLLTQKRPAALAHPNRFQRRLD